jgi:carboxyl-terminal processing protease
MLVRVTVLGVGLLTAMIAWADGPVANQRGRQPRVQTVSDNAALRYVEAVLPVLERVAASYHFEAIPKEKMVGQALLALYQASNAPPPADLQRNPDNFVGDGSLKDQFLRARKAVPESAALRYPSDVHTSLKAVFAKLDPFSTYVTVNQEVRRIAERGSGLGIYLEERPLGESYFVRSVETNSPAHVAGVRPGDEILEMDRSPITPGTPTVQVQIDIYLKFQRYAGVQLLVRHTDGVKQSITLSRPEMRPSAMNEVFVRMEDEAPTPILGVRKREDNEWDHWIDRPNRIGLIRLGMIIYSLPEFAQTVGALEEEGLSGLVLDLRDCPSGYPSTAADFAGVFLKDEALIASTEYRDVNQRQRGETDAQGKYKKRDLGVRTCPEVPLVVLVGPETSGAAEMIAAALQDHKRARIVGQRTRGKASIQTHGGDARGRFESSSNLAHSFKLTVGVFHRPSGKPLHRSPGMSLSDDWGVRPDVDVVLTSQLRRQVRAWWFAHDLLPPNTDQAHPLDDSRNDPVLDAGLRLLRKPLQPQ